MNKILLTSLIVILALGASIYWFWVRNPAEVASPTVSGTPDVTVNWLTYTSETYGFTVRYPESWQIKESSSKTSLLVQVTSQEMIASKQSPIELIVLPNQTVDRYVSQVLRTNHPKTSSESQSSLGGLAAKLVKVTPRSGSKPYLDTYLLTWNSKNVYGLKCHDAIGDPCNYDIFNAIASTFVFTR